MKRFFLIPLVSLLMAVLCASTLVAQTLATVKGVCKDVNGNPIAGATVEYSGVETGRKYTLKTNNKGEYFSLGIAPGKYNVKLIQDGKELFHLNNVDIG